MKRMKATCVYIVPVRVSVFICDYIVPVGYLWLMLFIDDRRSHFETGLSWFKRISRLHSKGKEFPLLFPAPHSFLFEFEKSDFYSSLLPSRFGQISYPRLFPVYNCSSIVPQKQFPIPIFRPPNSGFIVPRSWRGELGGPQGGSISAVT